MSKLLGAMLFVVLSITLMSSTVNAAYCGAARFRCFRPIVQDYAAIRMQCGTVMRSSKKIVYDQQEYTCYRTVYDRVVTPRTVTRTQYVREMQYREMNYTVMKPVWERKTRMVNYTVMRPVYETREKTYTVMKPVWETHTREIPYTFNRPVYETRERQVPYTVSRPVTYTKTIQVRSGHWETEVCERPGPVITHRIREKGSWVWDPALCRTVYCPGEVKCIQVQCPPVRISRRVWVPEVCEREITCVRYERQQCVHTCTYRVRRMVPEQRVRTQTYRVCRMVPEQRIRTQTYRVCRMVRECRSREVAYNVCRMVPEIRTRTVAAPVCRAVQYEETVNSVSYVPRQMPYTVSRCVPRVVCTESPIRVFTPVPMNPCIPAAPENCTGC
jgi:nitrogen fixation protein FixH